MCEWSVTCFTTVRSRLSQAKESQVTSHWVVFEAASLLPSFCFQAALKTNSFWVQVIVSLGQAKCCGTHSMNLCQVMSTIIWHLVSDYFWPPGSSSPHTPSWPLDSYEPASRAAARPPISHSAAAAEDSGASDHGCCLISVQPIQSYNMLLEGHRMNKGVQWIHDLVLLRVVVEFVPMALSVKLTWRII